MDYLESTFARFSCPDGISDVRSALKFEGNCSFGLHPTNVVGDVLAVKSSDKKPSTNVFRNRYFVGKARKVVPSTTAELTLFLSVVSLRAWVSPNTLFEVNQISSYA